MLHWSRYPASCLLPRNAARDSPLRLWSEVLRQLHHSMHARIVGGPRSQASPQHLDGSRRECPATRRVGPCSDALHQSDRRLVVEEARPSRWTGGKAIAIEGRPTAPKLHFETVAQCHVQRKGEARASNLPPCRNPPTAFSLRRRSFSRDLHRVGNPSGCKYPTLLTTSQQVPSNPSREKA